VNDARRLDRSDLVDAMIAEYEKKHDEAATIALFSKFIHKYKLQQHTIRTIILEFRRGVAHLK
jgi:hypothetical protein